MTDALDYYLDAAPSWQTTLDLFQGEWLSKLPQQFGDLNAGAVPLFNDDRLKWGIRQLGGVKGQTVLELGPLEGGHSYMLEQAGAASVLGIEANFRAYLKCLTIKELLDLKRSKFLYGNCVAYLKTHPGKFDFCCASGILYHMTNPAELIALVAASCDRAYFWTHYYDAEIIPATPHLAPRFGEPIETEYSGFRHILHRQNYSSVNSATFIGGNQPYSHWMTREGILQCLEFFGFRDIEINFEIPNHPSGPCFSLTAVKVDAKPPNDPPPTPSIPQLQAELQQAKDRIAAMESSKFWKLRSQWFKIKGLFGFKE
jgi:Protein of unknown function (DUF1698)